MTDLLTHPMCREEDLGKPIPDTEFGVSVCLPLWRHVVGYEEKDPDIVAKFKSGYPRFCCPPAIGALFDTAAKELGEDGERALVFPRLVHAQRCLEFIGRSGFRGRTVEWKPEKFGVALFPAEAYDTARRFWRFCGEVISTRQAAEALGTATSGVSEAAGTAASTIIRQRLAQLAGQHVSDVFLFPSGMAASFAVHRTLTRLFPQRKTIQLDFPYVDVLKLQQAFGSGAHFLPMSKAAEYENLRALLKREAIAGIFCEAPSNPLLRCVDFERLVAIRDECQPNVPIILDDTIATVAHADAYRVADAVTTSLTKSFSGCGDVLAGSLILNRQSTLHAAFSTFLRAHADHELWHGDAVALEHNSRDFAQRADVMSRNAQALADFLRSHPRVDKVWHPATEGGAGYEYIRRAHGGYGCLLSFVLKDAANASPPVYDALRISKGPSLGTNFSLACPYTLLAHYDELEWAESCGVPRHLIRVSAGLEATDDLIGRFKEALDS